MLKKIALYILFVSGAFMTCAAQDLIAMQAPVDHHTKTVDPVHLQRIIAKEKKEMPAVDLYNSWDTQTTHCYDNKHLPRTFKIDLRDFCMPTTSRRITSNYGYRRTFRRFHKGMDIKVYIGDTIRAAFDGKVRRVAYERRGYGNYVVIRHPNGLETYYAHMSKHLVRPNDVVKAGEPIGLGGNTGRSTGSHLHFECRLLGEAINPALLFDFPNQDVTGDFYVYHNPKGVDPQEFLVTNENNSSVRLLEEEIEEKKRMAIANTARTYVTKAGDTPMEVLKKLNVSYEHIKQLNPFFSYDMKFYVGQILKY